MVHSKLWFELGKLQLFEPELVIRSMLISQLFARSQHQPVESVENVNPLLVLFTLWLFDIFCAWCLPKARYHTILKVVAKFIKCKIKKDTGPKCGFGSPVIALSLQWGVQWRNSYLGIFAHILEKNGVPRCPLVSAPSQPVTGLKPGMSWFQAISGSDARFQDVSRIFETGTLKWFQLISSITVSS